MCSVVTTPPVMLEPGFDSRWHPLGCGALLHLGWGRLTDPHHCVGIQYTENRGISSDFMGTWKGPFRKSGEIIAQHKNLGGCFLFNFPFSSHTTQSWFSNLTTQLTHLCLDTLYKLFPDTRDTEEKKVGLQAFKVTVKVPFKGVGWANQTVVL